MNAIIGINVNIFQETEYERRRMLRLERLRLRSKSIFRLPDEEFRKMFRMNKTTFAELMHELTPHMRDSQRSDGISTEIKVCN